MRKRRRNALDKAYRLLETNPFIHYENGKMLLLSESKTETAIRCFR
jgi:DNA-binding transcriptional regulator YhcF (GntR family)